MPVGMYELVEKILRAVSFIAIGGAVALMFFVVFAQSIMGSKRTHNQLDLILGQIEKMNQSLKKISDQLAQKPPGEGPDKPPPGGQ